MDQGSAEWYAARRGKVTASRVADVLSKRRDGGCSDRRRSYMLELAAERLIGDTAEHYVSPAMEWGIEHEALARSAYEAERGILTDLVGFVDHPSVPMSGASPDGLVGADGLIEIKCPTTARHIETLLSGQADSQYLPQIAWQLECTGRAWCDFVTFDPRLPSRNQLGVYRVQRVDLPLDDIRHEVAFFLLELEAMVESLRGET